MSATPPQPDIPSFNVHVAVLPRAGLPVELHADEDECARLANACGIDEPIELAINLDVNIDTITCRSRNW